MTTLPAVVTITDLTRATTLSTSALFEAVQTTNGVVESVSVSLGQISTASLANMVTGFSSNAVLVTGATATSPFQVAAISTAGNLLIDQGAGSNPVFTVVGGDFTMSSAGTATIGTNVVSYAKIQQGTGLAVLGFATTAASNVTTFVASAANQVLAVATTGTSIAWRLPAMVLLNTLSPASVATAGDTTSFSTNYKSFLVTLDNVQPANLAGPLQLQVATSGTAFIGSTYVSNVFIFSNQNATVTIDTATTVMLLTGNRGTTNAGLNATSGVSGSFRIFQPAAAGLRRFVVGETSYMNSASTATGVLFANFNGYQDFTAAITGFQLSFPSSNIATGLIKVYGLT